MKLGLYVERVTRLKARLKDLEDSLATLKDVNNTRLGRETLRELFEKEQRELNLLLHLDLEEVEPNEEIDLSSECNGDKQSPEYYPVPMDSGPQKPKSFPKKCSSYRSNDVPDSGSVEI